MMRRIIPALSLRLQRSSSFVTWGLLILGAMLISGCGLRRGTIEAPTMTATPEAISMPTFTPSATATSTATRTPAPTSTQTPTATYTPTATSMPTQTPTPTPTPTPTHPLMIEVMRQRTYPGSDVTIEKKLEPGGKYDRYIASYLSDGLKIYALLTVPQGQKPATGWPVIVFIHGFIPPEQYRTTERYVAYVDAIARSGYIVFRPDLRGHGSSEGEATGPYGTPDYTIDALNAVASVKRYPDADANRIGMWGHSMGGQITLRAMVVTHDIKAGVIWAGVVASYPDLIYNWHHRQADRPTPTPDPAHPERRWRQELVETYGSPEENPAFWAAISPNSYLNDLSGPLQLHHATADESVPAKFSEQLYAQLLTLGKTVELYTYRNDNHNISANFGTAMKRSIQFFDTYVKGVNP